MDSDMELLEIFGANVRARRKDLGLSQEQLADIVGLHRTYIGGIERGERNISIMNLIKLANALHTKISILFEGIERNE